MEKVQITPKGIKQALEKYDTKQSIAEYIWNGFDAKATRVDVNITVNEIGYIESFSITDNGHGIERSSKFKIFLQSDKALDPDVQRNTSISHGKNGVGRLTFFKFAYEASWETVVATKDGHITYSIHIKSDTLDDYSATPPQSTNMPTGTKVSFFGIDYITGNFISEIKDFLSKEFCWFLELNTFKGHAIYINGAVLNYDHLIGERDTRNHSQDEFDFNIRFVQWKQKLHNEFSRYYFIDSKDEEKFKETTSLNNQGDRFYHSIYIQSAFYDGIKAISLYEGNERQLDLFGGLKLRRIQKDVRQFIYRFLREKRQPFLSTSADQLIAELKKENVIPDYGSNTWDKMQQDELISAIKEIYQLEPRIFSHLNMEQKKVITGLIYIIINNDEKDDLIEIISEVVKLSKDEREQFAALLKRSKLSNIIKTIKLIEDRCKAIEQLKELVFNQGLKANERDHVQKFIEQHYWIFGEQYHLVTAAEPKFEEALRRYTYLLHGETTDTKINHIDKNKEMDIFMVRQLMDHKQVHCIVVELKAPTIILGEKEFSQIKRYWSVIRDTPEFNSSNNTWVFYLVGNRYDKYIEGEIQNSKHHGESSLAYFVNNCKIFVKTWSDLFSEFEIKHKFLLEKLELERSRLEIAASSADNIVKDAVNNSAKQADQINIPLNS